jgi:2-oxo-3-(phosphooxy)propyl 3-oxoalkanoate synthase
MTEVSEIGVAGQWWLGEDTALSFDRTIDRRQVHRSAVSEVFITDVRALGESRVALAAQLPACHAYFGDHVSADVDPLLVMEICRQAGLATAYELGVSTDCVLATESWDLRIAEPEAWRAGGSAAIDLRIDSEFTWSRVRRGRPRAGTCRQRVFSEGRQVATLDAASRFLDYGELAVIRAAQRGSPPPWTAGLAGRADPEVAEPHVVGRRDPLNVVLAALELGADEVSARIALPLENRALFDHSYDHVTMQVLVEAARQLATAALGASPDRYLARLTGRFVRFAELDSPVTLRAAWSASEAAEREFGVVVEQEGRVVAEIAPTMARTPRSRS